MSSPQANPLAFPNHEYASARTSTRSMPRAMHLWHLASLDAPTVAVVWMMAFRTIAGVHLDHCFPILVACGTWTVYVADRLLDAQRAMRSGTLSLLRERHYFHWRHRRLMVPAACAAAAIAAALIIMRMPGAVLHRNSVLAAAALLYFSGVHSAARLPQWLGRRVSKEFLVGLLFTTGCAAPTLSRLSFVHWPLMVCIGLFTALAWLNCAAIECWESLDLKSKISQPARVLAIACFAAAAALSLTDSRASALSSMAGTSALLLGWLDHHRPELSPVTLRTLADAVLLTPVILLAATARHG